MRREVCIIMCKLLISSFARIFKKYCYLWLVGLLIHTSFLSSSGTPKASLSCGILSLSFPNRDHTHVPCAGRQTPITAPPKGKSVIPGSWPFCVPNLRMAFYCCIKHNREPVQEQQRKYLLLFSFMILLMGHYVLKAM